MREANYAIAAVMVGTIAITWTLGRVFGHLHDSLVVARAIVVRVCIGLILAIIAAQAALVGGLWVLLSPVLGLLALFSFAIAAVIVWGWTHGGL